MPHYFVRQDIQLRLITEDDFPILLESNHNPDIEQLVGGIYPMYSDEFSEFYTDSMKNGDQIFVIEGKKDGRIIGECGLHDLIQRNQTAEIAITLFDIENHRKGYGKQALEFLEEYAFGYLSLRKLTALIYGNNIQSIGFFEKNGYEYTGMHKADRLFRGAYEDTLIYSKFRKDGYKNLFGK